MKYVTKKLVFVGALVLCVFAQILFACQSEPESSAAEQFAKEEVKTNEISKNINQTVAANKPRTVNQIPVDPPKAPQLSEADKRIKKHGDNAVLRIKSSSKSKKKTKYKLNQANWNKLFPLTFHKLKKNYQYYIVADEFYKDGLPRIHGAAVEISGAIMPIDAPDKDGQLKRFWLANPAVVMAGCVFCNPPTMSDLIYVYVPDKPITIDREALYRSVLNVRIKGRFFIEASKSKDGVEYLFSMELKEIN